MAVFRTAYRTIKLWAIQRGLYSSHLGYIGETHIALMLSSLFKSMAFHFGHVTAPELVAGFFGHYADFDWPNKMVFDPFIAKEQPKYTRTTKEPMVILGLHAPNINVAHATSTPTLNTLIREFRLASQRLLQDDMSWSKFFRNQSPMSEGTELPGGAVEFIRAYETYAQVDIHHWGRTPSKRKAIVNWVESKCHLLMHSKGPAKRTLLQSVLTPAQACTQLFPVSKFGSGQNASVPAPSQTRQPNITDSI